MPRRKRFVGDVVTNRARLAEIENKWNVAEGLSDHSQTSEAKQCKRELMGEIYDLLGVRSQDQSFFRGERRYAGEICCLIFVSQRAIAIAENGLDIGNEVIWGQRRHHAIITGYTEDYCVRLQIIGSPQLKQRNRVGSPAEMWRVDSEYRDSGSGI